MIETIPNMNDFQMLKKINIGKNQIKKLEYIMEFSKLKYLQEIVIENNPILNNRDLFLHLKIYLLREKYIIIFKRPQYQIVLEKIKYLMIQ